MITESMLREAAAISCEIYVTNLEQGYEPENQHVFSIEFEKKLKRLKRKADHPVLYRAMHRVASIALAILVAGGVWITVDAEARATFMGWVKEIYETYFVYRFEASSHSNEIRSMVAYRPTWLPSGYTEFYVDEEEDTVAVVYANEEGCMLKLSYAYNPNETNWFVKAEQVEIVPATVNSNPAELLIAKIPETANAIMWTTPDNTAFYLSAFLGEDDLIKVAESIRILK